MFRLPPLPYGFNDLAPSIDREGVRRHYEDNHAGYIRKTNELIKGSGLEGRDLLDVALLTRTDSPLAHNAAQAWAHDFWWRSMTPKRQPVPSWVPQQAFERDWLSAGTALFGSGWLWLVLNPEKQLAVIALPNADLPWRHGLRPILVMDLWEHAYYCQYGTKRADYLKNTLSLLNWREAERRVALR
jgi:Fe-Mn family superoxide dismutase